MVNQPFRGHSCGELELHVEAESGRGHRAAVAVITQDCEYAASRKKDTRRAKDVACSRA
jgi:hypothetical protein